MNECIKLDMGIWNRAELFREFIAMTTSIYDMTVRMDVTNLVIIVKNKNNLFLSIAFILLCAN